MAEKMVDKVMRIMQKPDYIRNIAICAHIDHGKCISGSSRLVLEDGEMIQASDLFNRATKIGKIVEATEEQTVYDIKNSNLHVFSLNKETGSVEKKVITYAWKLAGGNCIKIRLRNGFEIISTPEHKYVKLNELEFADEEARNLKLGDRIVCPRITNTESNINLKAEILKKLSEKRFYVWINEKYGAFLKKLILENEIKEIGKKISSDLKPKSLYHGAWQNRYQLKDILKIAQLFNISFEKIYDGIEYMAFRSGARRGKNANAMCLPQDFKKFFYLAGLFIGDGHHKKFIVGKKELEKMFLGIVKDLKIDVTFRNYPGKTPEIVTNTTLLEVLNSVFDYPKKKKSHNVRISDLVFRSPKIYAAELLKAYFDCDGGVEKARRAISICSASGTMINDLKLLLPRFGCVPIAQGNTLYLTGVSLLKFLENIHFGLDYKERSAILMSNTIIGSYVSDLAPVTTANGNLMMKMLKERKGTMYEELAFIEVQTIESVFEPYVFDFTVEDNHNFVAEGMFIHNTTFSDNLLAGAGMMSKEDAGKALKLDFHADEQERGITIDTAAVSMVHNYENDEYLINLLDTPGHVDFGGEVTRAMRAADGAIVLVDSVEGIMPQTETVLRQALRELVKPVLFINKVDRLIKELQLTPEKMQERFVKIIANVNRLIMDIAPKGYGEKWQVNVQDGSVCFGSAFHKWALSISYMQKKSISFKDVIQAYSQEGKYPELADKAPLHEVVLDMVVRHLPNPLVAQPYRIPKIWQGEIESEEGKGLVKCDPTAGVFFVITKIVIDPQAGEISAGRLFSGTMKKGAEVYLNRMKQGSRVQQVFVYNGAKREIVDNVPAGNIIGVGGIKSYVGETVTERQTEPFEQITHIFEPVVTKAIEAKKPSDLPKLIEVLRMVGKEDPTVKIEINEETGEHLMHGMGELHLEVIENRIRTEKFVEVQTSPPIVVYRECITKKSAEVMGKTPNKHNHLFFVAEPLEDAIYQAIKSGKIQEMRVKKKELELRDALVECGMDSKEAVKVKDIFKGNLFMDLTRGQVHLGEVLEMIMDMFEDVMSAGPLAKEPCTKVKVMLTDMKLHEDAIHRGPAQIYPAVREGIRGAMMQANPLMLEPLQVLQIEAPADYLGDLSKLISNKRGQLLDVVQEGSTITVKAKMPVGEMFGWSSDLRSATGGRGSSSVVDQQFERLPEELQGRIIKQIRDRKGLTEAMVGA